MNDKLLSRVIAISILGASAILLGAFGAHSLKELLPLEKLNSFETGVRYQLLMAIYLLAVTLIEEVKKVNLKMTYVTGLLGTIAFAGSIYLLTLKHLLSVDVLGFIWPITPLGGILMTGSWILLGLKAKSIAQS